MLSKKEKQQQKELDLARDTMKKYAQLSEQFDKLKERKKKAISKINEKYDVDIEDHEKAIKNCADLLLKYSESSRPAMHGDKEKINLGAGLLSVSISPGVLAFAEGKSESDVLQYFRSENRKDWDLYVKTTEKLEVAKIKAARKDDKINDEYLEGIGMVFSKPIIHSIKLK